MSILKKIRNIFLKKENSNEDLIVTSVELKRKINYLERMSNPSKELQEALDFQKNEKIEAIQQRNIFNKNQKKQF